MGRTKQRTHNEDEFTRMQAKADRRERREADAQEKIDHAPKPRGLRSQGDVGVPAPEGAAPDPRRGRRAAATRFDAMPIAGHERLPGYNAPVTTDDEEYLEPGPGAQRPAPPGKPPERPPSAAAAEEALDPRPPSREAPEDASQETGGVAPPGAGGTPTHRPRRTRSRSEERRVG